MRDGRLAHISYIFPLEQGGVVVQRSDKSQVIYDQFEDYISAMIKSGHISQPRTLVKPSEIPHSSIYVPFSSLSLSKDEDKSKEEFFIGNPLFLFFFWLINFFFLVSFKMICIF